MHVALNAPKLTLQFPESVFNSISCNEAATGFQFRIFKEMVSV